MGWNEVHQTTDASAVGGHCRRAARFYFVHSYYPAPSSRELIAGYSLYPFPFTCAVARENLFAVQFHPEKSQAAGLRLLSNFVQWDGQASTAWPRVELEHSRSPAHDPIHGLFPRHAGLAVV